MSDIRVLMLAGQGESTRLMFNGIKNSFSIVQVILEAPVSKKQLLFSRLKRLGLATVIGQILFMIYNSIFLKNKSLKRINEIKYDKSLNDENIDEAIISRVDSINSDETKTILKEYRPDVVVVNGTRIIKKEIIEVLDVPFVNTHVGITPKYRGVHGGYWALTENDIEHCGVTVHLIDTGIDTGDILFQDVIEITDNDDFNTYPYLQMAAAIPLMKKAIHDIADKTYKTQKVELPSKLWSHPTIMKYLKHRIRNGVK